jgi:hypothetical protein
MTSRTVTPLLGLLALVALGAGCSSDTAPDIAASTVQADAGLIEPEALASFVPPAPAGWQLLAPPAPSTLEEDGAPLVSVTASYRAVDGQDGSGDRTVDLTIQDTGGRPIGLRRLLDAALVAPAGGSAPVPTTIRGQTAWALSGEGVIGSYILVADRYVVWLAVTGGGQSDLDAFVAALDLERLSAQR